jgi:hypothetical protein
MEVTTGVPLTQVLLAVALSEIATVVLATAAGPHTRAEEKQRIA